jgi:hypothetical protein
MKLKEIIIKSHYASVGYIESQEDINKLEQYIVYNLDILKLFKGVIFSTTYKEDNPLLIKSVNNTWRKYFPHSISIYTGISRGHSFGACDNDDAVFNYCKKNNIDWMCKSANDILLNSDILDIEVEDADFYYLNGIGFGGMVKYEFNIDKIVNEDFYPQTNFYFINIQSTNFLNDRDHIEEIYSKILNIHNYSDRPWEYGFRSCEGLLSDCITRNNLKKFHIVDINTYKKLLTLIIEHNIHDPSHKNILLNGICHYHFNNQDVIEI